MSNYHFSQREGKPNRFQSSTSSKQYRVREAAPHTQRFESSAGYPHKRMYPEFALQHRGPLLVAPPNQLASYYNQAALAHQHQFSWDRLSNQVGSVLMRTGSTSTFSSQQNIYAGHAMYPAHHTSPHKGSSSHYLNQGGPLVPIMPLGMGQPQCMCCIEPASYAPAHLRRHNYEMLSQVAMDSQPFSQKAATVRKREQKKHQKEEACLDKIHQAHRRDSNFDFVEEEHQAVASPRSRRPPSKTSRPSALLSKAFADEKTLATQTTTARVKRGQREYQTEQNEGRSRFPTTQTNGGSHFAATSHQMESPDMCPPILSGATGGVVASHIAQKQQNQHQKQLRGQAKVTRFAATEKSHLEKPTIMRPTEIINEGAQSEIGGANPLQMQLPDLDQASLDRYKSGENAFQTKAVSHGKDKGRQGTKHVLAGQLDYDVRLDAGKPTDQKFAPRPQHQPANVEIKVVYPTKEFGEENTEFKKRHESMQADADEHYHLLVDMQMTDPVFDRMLLENHRRKLKVESILAESQNWKRFLLRISPSIN